MVKDLDSQDLLDLQGPQEEMDHLDCQDHVGPINMQDHQVSLDPVVPLAHLVESTQLIIRPRLLSPTLLWSC